MRSAWLLVWVLLSATPLWPAAGRRKVIINEDCSGPGGSNMQALMMLLQSPAVDVLGITIVSGDQWRDEEVEHTLRLLEIMGRTDIPVMKGASSPLVRTREETLLWQQLYGKVAYAGAWDQRWWHGEFTVPPLPEGSPHAQVSNENAVSFLVRTVHQYPGEVTIYEGGPMTNLALAISLDSHFPELAEELVFMGGSLHPQSEDPEFANNPRHEFNFWFDPEAAAIVLRAPWKKIVCTPTDVSIKARLTTQMVNRMAQTGTPLAQYIARYFHPGGGDDYMWDELAAAAWLDPSMITKRIVRYMSVDLSHGAGYGNTLTWDDTDKPALSLQRVEIQLDLDPGKFFDLFASLVTRAARDPGATLTR